MDKYGIKENRIRTGKAAKAAAAGLCALMLMATLFSLVYVTAESGHDCIGEECPICAHIEQCEAILTGSDGQTCASVFLIMLAVAGTAVLCRSGQTFLSFTLISQNIRMDR